MNLCLYILAVAASLLFGVAVYTGLGLLVRRLIGVRDLNLDGLSEAPIIGWCVGLAALQIWHLFLPVNTAALALTVGAGIAGLLLSTRSVHRALSAAPRQGRRGVVVAFVVIRGKFGCSRSSGWPPSLQRPGFVRAPPLTLSININTQKMGTTGLSGKSRQRRGDFHTCLLFDL